MTCKKYRSFASGLGDYVVVQLFPAVSCAFQEWYRNVASAKATSVFVGTPRSAEPETSTEV